MKRKWTTKKRSLTIALEDDTFKALEKISKKEKLSRNKVIQNLLTSALNSSIV